MLTRTAYPGAGTAGIPPGKDSCSPREAREIDDMQRGQLRSAVPLAWVLHDPLPAVAYRPPDGRPDPTVWAEGPGEARKAVRGGVRASG